MTLSSSFLQEPLSSSRLRKDWPELAQFSEHAARRCHQRAVDQSAVRLALQWGDEKWTHGDLIFTLTDRALRRARQSGALGKDGEKWRGLCVVVSPEGVIRTVKWCFRCRARPGVLRRAYLVA